MFLVGFDRISDVANSRLKLDSQIPEETIERVTELQIVVEISVNYFVNRFQKVEMIRMQPKNLC